MHSAAKRNHESLFPMGEDLQFSQWMILTGRIFDPHSLPALLAYRKRRRLIRFNTIFLPPVATGCHGLSS